MPARYFAAFDGRSQTASSRRCHLCHHVVAVSWMQCGVAVRVEYDCWDDPIRRLGTEVGAGSACRRGPALPHGSEGGGNVAGCPAGEAGMNPDRGI
jgi:hypothetical protein